LPPAGAINVLVSVEQVLGAAECRLPQNRRDAAVNVVMDGRVVDSKLFGDLTDAVPLGQHFANLLEFVGPDHPFQRAPSRALAFLLLHGPLPRSASLAGGLAADNLLPTLQHRSNLLRRHVE